MVTIRRNRNPTVRIIAKISMIVVGLYLLACTFAYFFQEKLIFVPQNLSDEARAISKAYTDNVEDIELKMKDGTIIRGWFVKNNRIGKSDLIIYFGGNAEEVSRNIKKVSKFQQWSVALINYRDYGSSEGTTGEKTMFSDSLEIYDYFSSRSDINRNNIVAWG